MINIDISKLASEIGEPTARFVESEEEKNQRRMILGFTGAFLVVFIVGIFVFIFFNNSAQGRIDILQNEVSQLQVQNNALLQVEKHGATIASRNKNALQILDNNPAWSQAFTELEQITPKGIVFNRFEVEKKDSLKMTGQSPDYQTVSKFMISLAQSEFFQNVTLTSSSLTTREDGAIVEFAISFGISKDITRKSINPLLSAPENRQSVPVDTVEKENQVNTPPVIEQKPLDQVDVPGSSLPVL